MGQFYAAKDRERRCQYLGDPLDLAYFISNEGNFACRDGAFMEAGFEPVEYIGEQAYVEGEAPDSGEFFVYVNLEDYVSTKDGQEVLRVGDMIKFVKDHPLVDLIYIYDLASGAGDFKVNKKGNLIFTDAKDYLIELNDKGDYVFYVDGLRLRFKPADEIVKE